MSKCAYCGSEKTRFYCFGDGEPICGECHCSLPNTVAAARHEIVRLRAAVGEAYQVVGVLLNKLGMSNEEAGVKALDNLSAAANGEPCPHSDLLPFTAELPVDVKLIHRLPTRAMRDAGRIAQSDGATMQGIWEQMWIAAPEMGNE